MQERLKILKDALTLLAAPPATQLNHLNALGLPGGIDELALEYDDIAAAADGLFQAGEIDNRLRDCVKQLTSFLGQFGGQENALLWTPEAIHSAPQWDQVRRMAADCL